MYSTSYGSGGSGSAAANIAYSIKTDSQTTTSTTYVDVSDLSVTITPTSTSAKIKINIDLHGANSGSFFTYFNVQRDGATITAVSSSNTGLTDTADAWAACGNYTGNNFDRHLEGRSICFIDEPSTTSAVTYKVQMKVVGGTGACNQWTADINKAAISTIVAQEV